MAGYDPQKNRRRPRAADTGESPIDGLLGDVETEPDIDLTSPTQPPTSARSMASVPAPTVTPPPPVPDPDPRLVTGALVAGLVAMVTAIVLLRRWWRNR